MIVQAQEDVGDLGNGSIDLYLNLIQGGSGSTIGYGNAGHKEIFTYSIFFNQASDASIANHLTHEWCHKIGFDHAFYPWQDRNRDHSVPYAIGHLVEALSASI